MRSLIKRHDIFNKDAEILAFNLAKQVDDSAESLKKALLKSINQIDDQIRDYEECNFNREKTAYERKINFADIDKKISRREKSLIESLTSIISDEQKVLESKIRKGKSASFDDIFRKGFKGKIIRAIKDEMLSAAKDGRDEVLSIRRFDADPGYVASIAEKWIRSRASLIGDNLTAEIERGIKIILSNAIKTGMPLGEIIVRIQDYLEPYTAPPNIVVDDVQVSAHRVETLVRTNMTTAYNQGKLVTFRDPDIADFIHGVQYSAIRDSRTTEVCMALDKRVFNVDDPELDVLTPPNHYNCRSILVQVMIDEPIDDKDRITKKEIGRAKDLAGKGFV